MSKQTNQSKTTARSIATLAAISLLSGFLALGLSDRACAQEDQFLQISFLEELKNDDNVATRQENIEQYENVAVWNENTVVETFSAIRTEPNPLQKSARINKFLPPRAEKTPSNLLALLEADIGQPMADIAISGFIDDSGEDKDFKDKIVEAILKHPEWVSKEAEIGQAADEVNVVYGGLFPQIDASLSGGSALSKPDTTYQSSSNDRIDAVVDVRQLVFDFGALFRSVDAAEYRAKALKYEGMASRTNLILRAVTTYLDVVRLRNHVVLAQENVNRHQRILDGVNERVSKGVASHVDNANADSRMAEALVKQANLTGQLGRAEAAFMEFFGSVPEILNYPVSHPESPSVDSALASALSNNPTLLALNELTGAYQSDREATEASILPKVYLEASGTYYDLFDGQTSTGNGRQFGTTASLNVSYNIFSGGSDQAKVSKARIRAHQADSDRDKYRLELEKTLRSAYSDRQSLEQLIVSQEKAVNAYELTARAFIEQYNVGRRDLIDLLDTQADLFNSVLELVNSRTRSVVLRYQILTITGECERFFDLKPIDFSVAPKGFLR
ncbi:MAG: TolC family outer membrane protein [Magnetococcales bacterium]|nr:TolC family outer membrane protein [Magnetococcales bacterium]